MSWVEIKYLKIVSHRLQLFKAKKRGVYNCRCPICGDSKKSKTKARGYFYTHKDKLFYSCKNCGAPDHRTFAKFLNWFDEDLYKEYKLELFKESVTHKKYDKKPKELVFNYTKPEETPDILKSLDSIQSLGANHVAWKYAASRGIPVNRFAGMYFVDSMNVFCDLIPDYKDVGFDKLPRMILPFINKSHQVTHIQGRAIGDCRKDSRYVTLELVPDVIKCYGISTVDESKPIKVVEGPIDSLFLNNAVAMAGSDVDFSLFDPKLATFIYDN